MAKATPVRMFTSLPVKPDTLQRLRMYKTMGASYDEVLNDLMDLNPPAEFIKWHIQALEKGDFVSWDEVKKQLKL